MFAKSKSTGPESNLPPHTSIFRAVPGGESAAERPLLQPPEWEKLAFACRFKVSKLAGLCGVSVRTLQRYFLRHGLHAGQWLHGLRLHHAYHRLAGGEAAKVVAYDLGYKELSHFSRDFKHAFGVPPRVFASAFACGPEKGRKNLPLHGMEPPLSPTSANQKLRSSPGEMLHTEPPL